MTRTWLLFVLASAVSTGCSQDQRPPERDPWGVEGRGCADAACDDATLADASDPLDAAPARDAALRDDAGGDASDAPGDPDALDPPPACVAGELTWSSVTLDPSVAPPASRQGPFPAQLAYTSDGAVVAAWVDGDTFGTARWDGLGEPAVSTRDPSGPPPIQLDLAVDSADTIHLAILHAATPLAAQRATVTSYSGDFASARGATNHDDLPRSDVAGVAVAAGDRVAALVEGVFVLDAARHDLANVAATPRREAGALLHTDAIPGVYFAAVWSGGQWWLYRLEGSDEPAPPFPLGAPAGVQAPPLGRTSLRYDAARDVFVLTTADIANRLATIHQGTIPRDPGVGGVAWRELSRDNGIFEPHFSAHVAPMSDARTAVAWSDWRYDGVGASFYSPREAHVSLFGAHGEVLVSGEVPTQADGVGAPGYRVTEEDGDVVVADLATAPDDRLALLVAVDHGTHYEIRLLIGELPCQTR
jgi:hypothetical protein